jgi:prepilin-type N-terminal cleavage/methylation domain-containing protein/prepilin-type processing-associated H-X9-DG protein
MFSKQLNGLSKIREAKCQSKQKGFTLIELLVVIAIIALLLSILMPSLSKVKMRAKTIICMINCKTMATAWDSYVVENEDAIVSSFTGYSTYGNELLYEPLVCANPWTGWAGYQNDSANNEKRQTQAIEQGKLYPYLETTSVYHCPASKKYELRAFSIPDILGNVGLAGHETIVGLEVVTKMTQVKSPSSRIVFMDEGYATFGGYTIFYAEANWWDLPPIRHDNGVTLGFIDGHAQFYKWRDERTIKTGEGDLDVDHDDNKDLMMMQRGIFGSLGY